ncbi:hypothetical protein [Ornithinibacillus scapharcae]|uniref:hypothetical protein n=1 Tax=Ornithinibacillus scapharcae TaxID=1147159 RepID=UPI000225B260|nr:hypothetical protein [Ornithinibacillus scapharcae]
MKKFAFEVKDSYFPSPFNGEIIAENEDEAEYKLIDYYCSELGTEPSSLIVKVIDVNKLYKVYK